MQDADILKSARRTIELESEALRGLVRRIDRDFLEVARLIYGCSGRVVVSGIGKSAIIGTKIVSTLNSTGTPSIFMHAADAIHGDLGMVQKGDIVMVISRSGESPEIRVLIPLIRNQGNTLVAMVGNRESELARRADFILDTTVTQEACPNNLAPTASTTAQLAMGDALAVCLMEMKGFGSEDFAKFHPGGTLGKKLYLRVSDLSCHNQRPAVEADSPIRDVIIEMTEKRLGATAVTDGNGTLLGIVTDGDLRRMLERNGEIAGLNAEDIMSTVPKTIDSDALAVDALDQMRKHNITQLLVVEHGVYSGVVHLHDLLREGLI